MDTLFFFSDSIGFCVAGPPRGWRKIWPAPAAQNSSLDETRCHKRQFDTAEPDSRPGCSGPRHPAPPHRIRALCRQVRSHLSRTLTSGIGPNFPTPRSILEHNFPRVAHPPDTPNASVQCGHALFRGHRVGAPGRRGELACHTAVSQTRKCSSYLAVAGPSQDSNRMLSFVF